ncbi:CHAT domain-containing protein [Nodularia chucula]|uniref:CHAT domain-containing tetratricopeptide repeat protein n=1 Tax=Nodularia chucula TaxID=3093667 RepID=UPI0039C68CBF
MDEQQLQAYTSFIEQLLNCSEEEAVDIVMANWQLVDAGLLAVMEQYVERLQHQAPHHAQRLQQYIAYLSQTLQTVTALFTPAKDPTQFLLETLLLVDEHKNNPKYLYSIWGNQQPQMLALLDAFPQAAAQLYEGTEQRQTIASILRNFGLLIGQFPLGIRWLNLELGIAAFEQALQFYTYEDFLLEWAEIQNALSNLYLYRIRGEKPENVELAITSARQALQVYTRNEFAEDWARTHTNLAIAYLERIREDQQDNLETSIQFAELALQVVTPHNFPKGWGAVNNCLGSAYARLLRGERSENLEKAIVAYEKALEVRVDDAYRPISALVLHNLAAVYYDRIQGNKAENLEYAISLYKKALQVRTRERLPEQWVLTQLNLANAYFVRIRGERADNIERAIAIYEQTLEIATKETFPYSWGAIHLNLAPAYIERIRGKKSDNFEQSITASQNALQVFTRDASPRWWARALVNLANAYRDHLYGDKTENINQAILKLEQIQEAFTRESFPEEWATAQVNLATAYFQKLRVTQSDKFEQAIAAYQKVLEVYTLQAFPEQWATVQYNLALVYSECNPSKTVEAIAACQRALGVFTTSTFPKQCRKTAQLLGDLYSQQQTWAQAADVYRTALEAAEILYRSCVFLEGKGAELKENSNLSRCAAYAFAQNGHLQDAIEVLERGRARGLSESLDRDRANLAQLQQVAPLLYQQYRDITQQIRDLENQQRNQMVSSERHHTIPETDRNFASSLYQNLDQIIDEIRQVEGYADFLAPLNLTDVWSGIQPNNPLIYLVSTPVGSLALIVTSSEITEIWLDQLNEFSLINELWGIWFDTYIHRRKNRQGWFDAIDQITHQLWQSLMEPVVYHLKAQHFTQAILISTGFLSFLPLHAAWTEEPSSPIGRRYALDEIHFTYVPNARSLSAAQAIATHTQSDLILAIDDPRNDLPNSAREIEAAIKNFYKPTILQHSEATINTVRSQLPHHAIVHFSCHGTANLDDPLNSGLLMSDGLLTLRDILALNLSEQGGIRLAILSACETGLSGVENADEAISLPTGLLQAGVAGVVASLWAVSDLSTRLLLVKFYELWREEKLPPDQALRQAQIWLRDSTDGEKEDFIPDFIALDRSDRSFTHPYHWGAFSYTGV